MNRFARPDLSEVQLLEQDLIKDLKELLEIKKKTLVIMDRVNETGKKLSELKAKYNPQTGRLEA